MKISILESLTSPSCQALTESVFSHSFKVCQHRAASFKMLQGLGTKSGTSMVLVPTVAAVLAELGAIFTLKEEKRTTLKAFLGGKDVFSSSSSGFDHLRIMSHHEIMTLGLCPPPPAPTGSLELLLPGLTGSTKSDWSILNVMERRFIQSSFSFLLDHQFSMGSLEMATGGKV